MFYSVFMADTMPKQVITFHHFDANSEDRAENFSRYFIPPIIWLTIFASIVQSSMDATAKFAMLTASESALIFYSGIIVTGVSFAFGYTKSGIGFLNTNFKWLIAFALCFNVWDRYSSYLASKAYLWRTLLSLHRFYLWHPQFWGSSYLMSAYPVWHGPQC